jgi:hypothetical protein
MGSLYQRGSTWWMKYYANGRPIRESAGTTAEKEALRILKSREGKVADGATILPRADRIRYEDAAADLKRYYETTGKRDIKEAETRLNHLNKFFAGYRIAGITPSVITQYVERRQEEDATNATINRELATMSRLLRLAYKDGKLMRLPMIEKLKESARGRVSSIGINT